MDPDLEETEAGRTSVTQMGDDWMTAQSPDLPLGGRPTRIQSDTAQVLITAITSATVGAGPRSYFWLHARLTASACAGGRPIRAIRSTRILT